MKKSNSLDLWAHCSIQIKKHNSRVVCDTTIVINTNDLITPHSTKKPIIRGIHLATDVNLVSKYGLVFHHSVREKTELGQMRWLFMVVR